MDGGTRGANIEHGVIDVIVRVMYSELEENRRSSSSKTTSRGKMALISLDGKAKTRL